MNTIKKVKIAAFALTVSLLAVSCLPDNESIGGAGTTILRYTPGDQFSIFAIKPITTPQVLDFLSFKKDIPNSTALATTTTINLTMDLDGSTLISKYNTLHGTSYVPMPLTLFTSTPAISGGKLTLTYAPGDFEKSIVVTVPDASKFDFSKAYMVAFKVTYSGEGTFSKAISDTIYRQILAINKYDGVYKMKGFIMRPGDTGGLEGFFSDHEKKLATVGASAVVMSPNQLWANASGVGGIGAWTITVNETNNSITVTDPVAVRWLMDPTYPNRYDPAKKTFYFKVNWGAADPYTRGCVDTLVYVGPR